MTIDQLLANPLILVLAILTAILGVGRLTRVLTYDPFPPAMAIRMAWLRVTKDGPWGKLATCWWCASFWITLGALLWFWIGSYVLWIQIAWWWFFGALAISYLAAIIITRDTPIEPSSGDDE